MTQTIVQWAAKCRSTAGVKENPAGSNKTPFGVQFGWNGVAWCCEWAWDMYADAGVVLPIKSASVYETWQWARDHGYLKPSTDANVGAGDALMRTWTGKQPGQAGFDSSECHMQVILGRSGSALELMGGNQSDPSGGIVSYDSATAGEDTILAALDWSRLFSAPHPIPAQQGTAHPTEKPAPVGSHPLLYQGCPETGQTIPVIKNVQTRVRAANDGQFGPKTKAAVQAFQRAHGLVPDGVVGPKTYAALGL